MALIEMTERCSRRSGGGKARGSPGCKAEISPALLASSQRLTRTCLFLPAVRLHFVHVEEEQIQNYFKLLRSSQVGFAIVHRDIGTGYQRIHLGMLIALPSRINSEKMKVCWLIMTA